MKKMQLAPRGGVGSMLVVTVSIFFPRGSVEREKKDLFGQTRSPREQMTFEPFFSSLCNSSPGDDDGVYVVFSPQIIRRRIAAALRESLSLSLSFRERKRSICDCDWEECALSQ